MVQSNPKSSTFQSFQAWAAAKAAETAAQRLAGSTSQPLAAADPTLDLGVVGCSAVLLKLTTIYTSKLAMAQFSAV